MRKSLYVGNLPWEITENELMAAFQNINQVDDVRVTIETDKRTGLSRGFAFVDVPEEKIDKVVRTMHGYELGGRTLIVN
jgi:cold-inducible RNA-binding protein